MEESSRLPEPDGEAGAFHVAAQVAFHLCCNGQRARDLAARAQRQRLAESLSCLTNALAALAFEDRISSTTAAPSPRRTLFRGWSHAPGSLVPRSLV